MAVRTNRRAVRRRNRRRWRSATVLTPTVLLVAASSALLSLPPPAARDARVDSSHAGGRYGASGTLPRALQPSTELLDFAAAPRKLPAPVPDAPLGRLDIPEPMLAAYVGAADRLAQNAPGCGVHWSVLASIGRIESGHARGGRIDSDGITSPAILGPRLDGSPGVAAIPDTDGGALDGDPVWDRAVGAMQFIPDTWHKFATDGDDDGVLDPHDVHDAVATAGRFLCDGGADLRRPRALAEAVFRYNHSEQYVRTVLVWAEAYRDGVVPQPQEPLPDAGDDVLAGSRLPAERPHAAALPPGFAAQAPRPGAAAQRPGAVAPRPGEPGGAAELEAAISGALGPAGAGRPGEPGTTGSGRPGQPGEAGGRPGQPGEPGSSAGAAPSGRPSTRPAPSQQEQPGQPGDPAADQSTRPVPPSHQQQGSAPSGGPATWPELDLPDLPGPEPERPATAPEQTALPGPASEQSLLPGPVGGSTEPGHAVSPGTPSRPGPAVPPEQPAPEPPISTGDQGSDAAQPPAPSTGSQPSSTEQQPTSPAPATTAQPGPAEVPDLSGLLRCEPRLLAEGRFVPAEELDPAARDLPAGTSGPHRAEPGEVVFVPAQNSGPLQACEVPADFRPGS